MDVIRVTVDYYRPNKGWPPLPLVSSASVGCTMQHLKGTIVGLIRAVEGKSRGHEYVGDVEAVRVVFT